MRKKLFTVIICAAVIFAVGFSVSAIQAKAQAQDDMDRRLEAAKAYEKVTPVSTMIDGMFSQMAKNPQLGMTAEDIAVAKASLDKEEMRSVVIEKMAKHFSEAELRALAEFYGSPEGQSIVSKFPAYMADVMPYIQQAGIKAALTALQNKQQEAPE